MEMTLQEAKDKVANDEGFDVWFQLEYIKDGEVDFYFRRAIELYAQSAAQEARESVVKTIIKKAKSIRPLDVYFYKKELIPFLEELLNLKEKKCQCSFAMIRRDQETQKAYCFECKKEIEE